MFELEVYSFNRRRINFRIDGLAVSIDGNITSLVSGKRFSHRQLVLREYYFEERVIIHRRASGIRFADCSGNNLEGLSNALHALVFC